MQFNQLSQHYTVSGQITPDDIALIAQKGFKTVICNRPDGEIPSEVSADVIRLAAEQAGLKFHENPFDGQSFCQATVETQSDICASCDGPVFAYCASGNRCSVVWAFTQAANVPADELIYAAAQVGYQLAQFKPTLDAMYQGD